MNAWQGLMSPMTQLGLNPPPDVAYFVVFIPIYPDMAVGNSLFFLSDTNNPIIMQWKSNY